MSAVEARLTTARVDLEDVSSRVAAIAQGGETGLADGLAAIQGRVSKGADDLVGILERIHAGEGAPASSSGVETPGQIYSEFTGTVLSLDIASRQLQGLLRGSTDHWSRVSWVPSPSN